MQGNKKIYDDIEEYLNKNYSNFNKIQKIKKIAHDDINSRNYLINTKSGKFLLHNFNDNHSNPKMERMCKVLIECSKKKRKFPVPILNKKKYFIDKKNRFYLTNYIKGGKFRDNFIQLSDIGKNLAELHIVLNEIKTTYNFHTRRDHYNLLDNEEMLSISKIIKKRSKQDFFDKIFLKNFKFMNQSFDETQNFLENTKPFLTKKQLIHFDMHPDNVLFTNNKVSGILDFQYLHKGLRIQDIVYCGFRFSIFNKSNVSNIIKKMKIFCDSYIEINQIPKSQLYNLNNFLNYEIMSRLSFVIRERFFHNSQKRSDDLSKFIDFMKLSNKLKSDMKNKISNKFE